MPVLREVCRQAINCQFFLSGIISVSLQERMNLSSTAGHFVTAKYWPVDSTECLPLHVSSLHLSPIYSIHWPVFFSDLTGQLTICLFRLLPWIFRIVGSNGSISYPRSASCCLPFLEFSCVVVAAAAAAAAKAIVIESKQATLSLCVPGTAHLQLPTINRENRRLGR